MLFVLDTSDYAQCVSTPVFRLRVNGIDTGMMRFD